MSKEELRKRENAYHKAWLRSERERDQNLKENWRMGKRAWERRMCERNALSTINHIVMKM